MLEILVLILLLIILLLLAGAGVAGIVWYRSHRPSNVGQSATVKRIELSGGNWAKVRSSLTQAMWDALVAAKSMIPSVDVADDGRLLDVGGVDVTNLVSDIVSRSLMLSGISEWSYGPVDESVLASEVPLEDQEVLAGFFDDVLSRSSLWRRVTGGN